MSPINYFAGKVAKCAQPPSHPPNESEACHGETRRRDKMKICQNGQDEKIIFEYPSLHASSFLSEISSFSASIHYWYEEPHRTPQTATHTNTEDIEINSKISVTLFDC